jgi:hypothetical protein
MNNFIDLLPKWSSVVIWGIVLMIYFFIGCSTLIGQEDIKPDNRWSGESITLYTTLQGLSMIDAKQTFMMDEYRSYFDEIEPISYAHEVNPLMGDSPTSDRIVAVKLLSGALTFYGLNKMKEVNRKKALTYLNVFYLIVVIHNNSLGLSINL